MKPKLLFLCQTLPYPPDAGVNIRTFHVLRLLAEQFDVTALCFYRRALCPTAAHVDEGLEALREYADVQAFPIPQEYSRGRLLWDHVRSVAARRPYTHYAYDERQCVERVRELVSGGGFSVIHVDSLDLVRYLPLLKGAPTVCTHHNIESALLRRRAVAERSAVRRRYLQHQAELTARTERRWCARVNLNVVVSGRERDELLRIAPDARVTVVPNGVDTDAFRPAGATGRGIVFVGGQSWLPNADAMEYFGSEILPLVRTRLGDVPAVWVGRAAATEVTRFDRQYGIRLTGYVDDVRPYVASAACYVVPLRIGGGTRLKILDAWAMGSAVVSTSVGCEGLQAEHGANILIADAPAEFADRITEVLSDHALRADLGRRARQTAVRSYDWRVVGEAMTGCYRDLLASGSSRRRGYATA